MGNELHEIISKTHNVYAALSDNLSKYLFRQLITYGLTRDYSILQETHHAIFKCLIPKERKIVAFGGGMYIGFIGYYKAQFGLDIVTVIDSSPKPNHLGIEVINAAEFLRDVTEKGNLGEYVFLINVNVTQPFIDEMKNCLLRSGVPESDIFYVTDIYHAAVNPGMSPLVGTASHRIEQYFDLDLGLGDDEVFVDAGVCNGFSSISFARNVKGKYRKIYAFEPDERWYKYSDERMSKAGLKYELIEKGLWSKSDKLSFSLSVQPGGSQINEIGETSINVISIDEYFQDKADKPTFIKMDIEGAEYDALIGMEQTIRNHKPKLAICVYHRPEDLLTIPQLCLSYNPDYKIYLRKYPLNLAGEFVMYFV